MVAGSKLCASLVLVLLLFMADVENSVGSTGDENGVKISMGGEDEKMAMRRSRRMLLGVMDGDRVPCSKIGHHHCGESGQANPYKRPCTKITHCHRDTGH